MAASTREAILLVGHGSPNPAGNVEFLTLAHRVRAAMADRVVQPCFIEFAEPGMAAGLDACVAAGARRVLAAPVILFAAGHVKGDIPAALAAARARHPGVEFVAGRPIGLHPRLVGLAGERLAEAIDGQADEAALLVVGRGSSDPDANSDLCKVARLVWEGRRTRIAEVAFIGVTQPDVPEGLRRCAALGARRIVVLPYFLFTGVLIPRLHGIAAAFAAAHPGLEVRVARYFGPHPNLVQAIRERADEAARAGEALPPALLAASAASGGFGGEGAREEGG
jgi:sirohydrochlorin cobaltochelatase